MLLLAKMVRFLGPERAKKRPRVGTSPARPVSDDPDNRGTPYPADGGGTLGFGCLGTPAPTPGWLSHTGQMLMLSGALGLLYRVLWGG